MTLSPIFRIALTAPLLFGLGGCAAEPLDDEDQELQAEDDPDADDPISTSDDAIIGGTATTARPEVGMLVFRGKKSAACVATLVAPRVLLTAAHCVLYTSMSPRAGSWGYWEMTVPSYPAGLPVTKDVPIDGWHSFGSTLGAKDIALVHLRSAVPLSQAPSRLIARSNPPSGASVTTYGYGCTNRTTSAGTFVKRRRSFFWGNATKFTCPGDSGGPTFYINGIVRVSSAWDPVTGRDIFANPIAIRSALYAQINAWP